MGNQIGLMNIEEICKKLNLTPLLCNKLTWMWNHLNMLKYAPSINPNSKDNLGEEKAKLLSLLSVLEKEIK